MGTLTIGGVPEHFNLPWKMAIKSGAFDAIGTEVRWHDWHGGTGEMMRKAAQGDVDVALVLTEGAIAHIAREQSTRIVGTWVESPLVWGIHCGPRTQITPGFPHDGRMAISRRGSGSHLMPLLHAHEQGHGAPLTLVEIGSLDGALSSFADDRVDAFYWERVMTIPYVRAGQLRLMGEYSAPWPAFVAVRAGGEQAPLDDVWLQVLEVMRSFVQGWISDGDVVITQIADAFSLSHDDASDWLARTRWAACAGVDHDALNRAGEALKAAGVLTALPALDALAWRRG